MRTLGSSATPDLHLLQCTHPTSVPGVRGSIKLRHSLTLTPVSAVFHRDIAYEMGELGVLGPTIKGKNISFVDSAAHTPNILKSHPFS